jgi:hypothetical protein
MTIKITTISEFASAQEREDRLSVINSAMSELSATDCKVMVYQARENPQMLVEVWLYPDAERQAAILDKWENTPLSPPRNSTHGDTGLDLLTDISWQE